MFKGHHNLFSLLQETNLPPINFNDADTQRVCHPERSEGPLNNHGRASLSERRHQNSRRPSLRVQMTFFDRRA